MIALTCRICGRAAEAEGIDLGAQPVSNRFRREAGEPDFRHPLAIAQCPECALVQLAGSFPVEELRPRFSWIRYREREDHLAAALAAFLPFLEANRTACGITDFDTVLFRALPAQLGLTYTQLSPTADLGITASAFGMETFQQALTPERARAFAERRGKCGLLISRYLFEHASDPAGFLRAARELLADDGLLLLEVPDAEAPLERKECHVIWEEHVSYFTERTLRSTLTRSGFSVRAVYKAASKFEQPLLVLARKHPAPLTTAPVPAAEFSRFATFSASYHEQRAAAHDFCRRERNAGRKVVLFGAGHFTVAFVGFFALQRFVYAVIDDEANKRGLLLPALSLPIVASDYLLRPEPGTVLLCVNPDVEARVMEKLKVLIPDTKSCYSIFAGSPRFYLHA